MSREGLQKAIGDELYVSHSQINTYLNCALRYRFQYVERRAFERTSLALPFGGAIHSAIEHHYRTLKASGRREPLPTLQRLFEECLRTGLEWAAGPVIFKREVPDLASATELGKAMLAAFHDLDQTDARDIIGVELPFTAMLFTEQGLPTEFKLAGVIDLLLRDERGEPLVVDFKTAAKPMAQSTADDDFQMSAYAYLLASNRHVFPTAQVNCRFEILRKLKQPIVQIVQTVRTAQQRKRFAKLANLVLAGIDSRIFLPQPSWMCADCPYADACKAW